LIYGVISARLEVWALGIETSARIQPLYLHARKQPEPGLHSPAAGLPLKPSPRTYFQKKELQK